jgi:hypothetical protein
VQRGGAAELRQAPALQVKSWRWQIYVYTRARERESARAPRRRQMHMEPRTLAASLPTRNYQPANPGLLWRAQKRKERNHKGSRLAGSRRGAREEVAALHHDGHCLHLDGGWFLPPCAGCGAQQLHSSDSRMRERGRVRERESARTCARDSTRERNCSAHAMATEVTL